LQNALKVPVESVPGCSRQGIACLCAGVSYAELDQAVAGDSGASVESLGAALGCGVQCGSCIPAIKEALGEVAWFGATASCTPITRPYDDSGLARLIFRVEITLTEEGSYPLVLPGQHVVLRARTDRGLIERTYTVVNQNQATRQLTVAVRRNPDGKMTPWLLEPAPGGGPRRIEVSVPGGPVLGLRRLGTDVFLAGGVGVTPAMAMANALLPSARMHLDYCVTHADDAAFLPEFEARRLERPNFSFRVRESSVTGNLSERDIRKLVARFPDAKFYVCGPEGYSRFVHGTLQRAGLPEDQIHLELFALAPAKAPARSSRFKAYVAGAVLALLPLLLLLPDLQELRPHGHPNVGHEQLKCVSCHAETSATLRQTFQAKVKHVVGLRQTGAVMGMLPVNSATCIQCHANSDDTHATQRFLEPRFEKARAETGAQVCVSCHREHSAVRVTAPNTGYCVSCHQDMKVKNDKTSPTHERLVLGKRWDTCLQCHDYHGNHKWNAPLRLTDATALDTLNRYLKDGPSPYGAPIVKSKQPKPL